MDKTKSSPPILGGVAEGWGGKWRHGARYQGGQLVRIVIIE
jgi:hypothetical protein